MRTIATSLALVAAASGIASAQDAIGPAGPLTSPGFSTIDRLDATSRVGGELSFLVPDNDDLTALRFDLHGHYVSKTSGFGGYVAIPISYFAIDSLLVNDSNTDLGNVELGGLYVRQLGAQTGIVVRGGLMLPTAGDSLEDVLTNAAGGLSRVTDYAMVVPEGLTLRLAVSPMFRSGSVYGRVDAGLDVNLSDADDDTTDPAVRLNAAIGVIAAETIAISGELALLASTDDDQDSLTTLAIAGRYAKGKVHPYLAIVIPLEEDVSDDLDLALTLGVEALLP